MSSQMGHLHYNHIDKYLTATTAWSQSEPVIDGKSSLHENLQWSEVIIAMNNLHRDRKRPTLKWLM